MIATNVASRSNLTKHIIVVGVFYLSFVGSSNFLNFIGLSYFVLMALFVGSGIVLALINGLSIKLSFLLATLSLMVTPLITALYWGDYYIIFSSSLVICALYVMQNIDRTMLDRILSHATSYIFIILTLSIIAFFYRLYGGESLYSYVDNNGRVNNLYLTSFSTYEIYNFIRPAGIYDEPGALSFYVCAIAALRNLLNKDSKQTWVLLVMGLVTFSVAHVVYMITHFAVEKQSLSNVRNLLYLISVMVVAVIATNSGDYVNNFFLSRLLPTGTESEVVGDNRSILLFNSLIYLAHNPMAILFGADETCRFNFNVCEPQFPPMGENPLTLLVYYGLFLSWPYYLFLLIMLLSPIFGKRYWVTFGMGLLFAQRPYFLGAAGAFVGVMLVVVLYYDIKVNRASLRPDRDDCRKSVSMVMQSE
jgi:hypothetical protein